MKKIIFFVLFLSNTQLLLAQVPQSERDALIALYNATDGDNWTTNTYWNTDESVANWYGVTVENIDGADHVTKLYLYDKNLNGYIPAEMGNLTYLSYMNLSTNLLSGTIPAEIGNLINLTSLLLNKNELTGELPAEMNNLTNLTKFYIYNNNFQFEDLELTLNDLIDIINNNYGTILYSPMNAVDSEINIDMVTGENYTFTMSEIRGTNVTYQWYHNDTPIEGATDLTYSITGAQENDLGDYVCKASSPIISDLTIDRNPIHLYGTIDPTDKNALIALYNTTDGDNWLDNTNWNTSEPVYTWHGVKVQGDRVIEIELIRNNLNGNIPPEIGDLSELSTLNLSENGPYYDGNLTGDIPTEIGNLSKLKELIINLSALSGEIPPEIGNLTNLVALEFWDNYLTGTIPDEIGNLTNLELFTLEHNELTGSIPDSFSNLTKLQHFWLNENQLTGDVPDIFRNMQDLVYVSIFDNPLTGSIDLSQNHSLKLVYVQNTQISCLNLQNGNNQAIPTYYFKANDNPNLNTIYVDDATYSVENWTYVDDASVFNDTPTDCSNLGTSKLETNSIRIYPNPVHNIINIENSGFAIQKITIYNLEGQKLQEILNRNLINVSQLANGIYLLTITGEDGNTETYKIIKK